MGRTIDVGTRSRLCPLGEAHLWCAPLSTRLRKTAVGSKRSVRLKTGVLLACRRRMPRRRYPQVPRQAPGKSVRTTSLKCWGKGAWAACTRRASADGTARLWDVSSGESLGEPMTHGGVVRCAAFSPDGKQVVTASDDFTARIWDAYSGKPVSEPMRHEGQVLSAVFSADGTKVITASSDKTARLWEAPTGKPLGKPMKHRHTVHSAAFSPDGSGIVTTSDDGSGSAPPASHRRGPTT